MKKNSTVGELFFPVKAPKDRRNESCAQTILKTTTELSLGDDGRVLLFNYPNYQACQHCRTNRFA